MTKQATIAKILLTGALVGVISIFSMLSANAAGLLKPVDSNLPELEIKSHDVEVTIQDGFIITEVEQVFSNKNNQDLSALYEFPIPEKALVSAFTVWIDGKPVVGEVLEKDKARQVYQSEKQAGRETGLTEQNSYKSFEVSVTPVRAHSDTRIKLQYMQTVDIDTGIGRYVYPLEDGGTDEEKLSFWTSNQNVKERFSFKLVLRSAYPIDAVRLPNIADAVVKQHSKGQWSVYIERNAKSTNKAKKISMDNTVVDDDFNESLSATEFPATGTADKLNQDVIVYWRMAEGLPGSLDLTTYKTKKASKGTFMLVVSPGEDLPKIESGRDWVFVLDISGSMKGKYATLVDGVSRSLQKIDSKDRFRIITFNNDAKDITSGWSKVNPENTALFTQKIESIQPNGSTNLYGGLKLALRSLDKSRSTGIVLVTDGVANIGEKGVRGYINLLKKYDVRLFTMVLGNSANRPLLNSISQYSNGFAINISNNDDIVGMLMKSVSKVSHQAMHDVRIKIKGVKTSDVTPEILGSVYRGEQLVIMGNYWGSGEAKIEMSAKVSGKIKRYSSRFQLPNSATEHPELERLWAFAKIQALQEEQDLFGNNDDTKQAIRDLSLQYSIVTEDTSMIVMREEQFAKYNIKRTNQQRVLTESQAQSKRSQAPVKNTRVDNKDSSTPMFTSSRPSYSGGGSLDWWWLLLIAPIAYSTIKNRISKRV